MTVLGTAQMQAVVLHRQQIQRMAEVILVAQPMDGRGAPSQGEV